MTARARVASALEPIFITIFAAPLALYAVTWVVLGAALRHNLPLRVPQPQSAAVIGVGIVILRASSAPRRERQLMTLAAFAVAVAAFVLLPLPERYYGHIVSDPDVTRATFDTRFPFTRGVVNLHSHLGDVLMGALDKWYGTSASSPVKAYDTTSRLAGLLYVTELVLVGIWHRWSRRYCRFAALAIAAPFTLLFFAYRELGYLSLAVGSFPLLVIGNRGSHLRAQTATWIAGFLQGLHTALYSSGVVGIAAGALASLFGRGDVKARIMRSMQFTSAAVAFFMGWVFIYLQVAGLNIRWNRSVFYRPLLHPVVFDSKIANPLLSLPGLGELGLWSAIAGVPMIALAVVKAPRTGLLAALAFAFPCFLFVARWWPYLAPYDLDLLLSAFPAVVAGWWLVSWSSSRSWIALVILVLMHVLVWTALGNAVFQPQYIPGR
jgi:hypothetical protein